MQLRQDNLLGLAKFHIRRLNIGQIIIGFCIIGLSVWCLINVLHIIDKYYKHETIISLQNDPPNSTDFPGITICAPTIFKPQTLAKLYPKFNEKYQLFIKEFKENREKLRTTEIYSDPEIGDINNRSLLFRRYESMALENFTGLAIIKKYSVRPEDLLERCSFNPINIRSYQQSDRASRPGSKNCTATKPILESIYEEKKCFTYYSWQYDTKDETNEANSFGPNESQEGGCKSEHCESDEFREFLKGSDTEMRFDLNPNIEVVIKSVENDIWQNFVRDPILMTVHPPNIMQNKRDFLFIEVIRSNFYEIAFTKKTTHLLPPPHRTMCIIYRNEPSYKAKTRDECISMCINRFSKEKFLECANYYSVLTEETFSNKNSDQKICKHENQNYNDYLEARTNCEEQCPDECEKIIFEITGQMRNTIEDNCAMWYNELATDFISGPNSSNTEAAFALDSSDDLINSGLLKNTPLMPMVKWGHSITSTSVRPKSEPGEYYDSSSSVSDFMPSQQQCNSQVSIRISPKPFTIVRHQQAITYEGFLGTIGGHIGIWLGLSLYKIIKFVVHILYNLLHKAVRNCSPKFVQTKSEAN